MIHIIEHLLTSYVMILTWCIVIIISVLVTYKTKLYGVLVIGGGAIPFLIFYVYQRFGVWDTHPYAILYSRAAGISLSVSLSLALWMMYRSIKDGSKQYSDSS